MRPRARLLAGAATVLLLLMLALGAAGAKKGKAGRGQAKGKGQGRGDGSSGAADVADVYDHWCGAALVDKGTGQVDAAVQRLPPARQSAMPRPCQRASKPPSQSSAASTWSATCSHVRASPSPTSYLTLRGKQKKVFMFVSVCL